MGQPKMPLATELREWFDLGRHDDPKEDPADPPKEDPADPPKEDPADPPKDDEDLGERGKKALENERKLRRDAEKRAKELEVKAKAYDEEQEAKKTKEQKDAEALQQLKDEAAALAQENLRLRVAKELDVDPDLLAGTTEDEVREHAKKLLDFAESKNSGSYGEPKNKRTPGQKAGEKSGAGARGKETKTDLRDASRDDLQAAAGKLGIRVMS